MPPLKCLLVGAIAIVLYIRRPTIWAKTPCEFYFILSLYNKTLPIILQVELESQTFWSVFFTVFGELRAENEKLKQATTCKVCLDADVDTVFLPCRHLVCCRACADNIVDCPVCRERVLGTVKTFLAWIWQFVKCFIAPDLQYWITQELKDIDCNGITRLQAPY